jgi:hypothetical protein
MFLALLKDRFTKYQNAKKRDDNATKNINPFLRRS